MLLPEVQGDLSSGPSLRRGQRSSIASVRKAQCDTLPWDDQRQSCCERYVVPKAVMSPSAATLPARTILKSWPRRVPRATRDRIVFVAAKPELAKCAFIGS
jgi:hypothetical protein